MGDKPKPPALPKGAPKDYQKFLDCDVQTLTLSSGKVDWLKLKDVLPKKFPGSDWVPDDAKVEVSFEADPNGAVKIGIGMGGLTLISLPVSVKNGQLQVDTSGVPNVGGAPAGVKKWVDDLNGAVKANGKQISGVTLKNKVLTLDKSPLAAVLPSDGGAQHASTGSQFSTGGKVLASGLILAGVVAGVALKDVNDTTQTQLVSQPGVVQSSTPSEPAPSTSETSSAPTEVPPISVFDGTFGTRHVRVGLSYVQVCVSLAHAKSGRLSGQLQTTPSGPLRAQTRVRHGLARLQFRINQFGSYSGLTLTGPDGNPIADLGKLVGQQPWVVDATPKPCDPKSLNVSEGSGLGTNGNGSSSSSSAPPSSVPNETVQPPPVTTTAETTTVDNPPWSLLFIPSGLLMGLGALFYDARRRRSDDVDDLPPPPLPWSGAAAWARQPPVPPTMPTTIEKPGTGNPDAVQSPEYQVDPDAPPIGFSDNMWRTLQLATSQAQQNKDGYPPPIHVIAGTDTWFVPDHLNSLESGDKVALAFKELIDSGKLGDEFVTALEALLSPESVFFFGSMIAIQLIPGVNVAVDFAAFLILCAYLGESLSDFVDALQAAGNAINQQQLTRAVDKLAKVIAQVGVIALTALVAKITGKVVEKVVKAKEPAKPVPEATKAPKSGELGKGGTHDALFDGNKSGTFDALPEEKPAVVDPNKTVSVDPKDFATDLRDTLTGPEQNAHVEDLLNDPTDPPKNWVTGEPLTEIPEVVSDEAPITSDTFDMLDIEVSQTEPTAIEIREINYQKMMKKGVSAAERAHLEKVRAADVERLRSAGPDFWNSIEDPQTRTALEALRDSRP